MPTKTLDTPLASNQDVCDENQIIDVFLQPGDLYFGDADTRIRTILGSCIAITLWHPEKKIGGMCHFLLPTRGHSHHHRDLDGRYCDEAIALFAKAMARHRTPPNEYEAKVFGGGNMFPAHIHRGASNIGARNAESALRHLDTLGIRISKHHLCGAGHRQVIFEVWTGDVWLRHMTI
ncbi:chemotaxis protein CheD [Uliginosibacterium gangwonense]|uniref:chemotaxis protein CheD n=1 Tax=Uliginosibacterium gangwonense TaxID=392736 RepID=UPI00036EAF48|nr:chemotaxis protein CheD [Uliginosibacterium gangwonense]